MENKSEVETLLKPENLEEQKLDRMKITGPESHLGQHIVAEFFSANFESLNNANKLEEVMRHAALNANATIRSSHNHVFEPHGVSCNVILQDSNLCIHTWP